MKKSLLILALAQAAVFAQTGLLGGGVGLHQQNANTLGFFKLRGGTGGTIATDNWGYTRAGQFVDDKGVRRQFDEWDANMEEGRIDGALAGNFNIALGVMEDLDVGISLPIYYDHSKDLSTEAIQAGMVQGGLGDIQVYGKYRTPHIGPEYLSTAAVLDVYLPTGWKQAGLRPRHAWFLNGNGGYTYAYTANSLVVGLTGVAALDFTKQGKPIIWNNSLGYMVVLGDGSNTLVYSTGLNYIMHKWFQPFLEFSGEMRLGNNDYPINPLVDPMLLTPGFNLKLPFLDFIGDVNFAMGIDIGVRNLLNVGYDVEEEMDGCEDFQLKYKGSLGRTATYCYVAHPLIAGIAKLTVTLGLPEIRDGDEDGVKDDKDQCPHTPKPIVVDSVGCGIDSDNDRVFDGLDKCPNTPEGVVVDVDGCPVDTDGDKVPDYKDQCPNTPEGVAVDSVGCPLDDDKDLVPNYKDQCPNTPEGVKVDSLGCPLDDDKDGVPNFKDQCPNTPEGVKVDSLGCPLDDDKDGVPNFKDQCPDTPEGAEVDSVGCTLDTDKDGVPNYLDKCPNTLPGIEVDNVGCPLQKKQDLDQLKKGIQFEFNSAKLTKNSYGTLDDIIELMKQIPEANLEVQGHTDIVGTEDYNQWLSEERAHTVTDYFIKKGVEGSRLRAVGFGTRKPLADNETEEGRAQNRRVELVPFERGGGNSGFVDKVNEMQKPE